MDLPAGFTTAPLADADLDEVVSLVRACELNDSGVALYERADLLADLGSHGMDRDQDAVVVRPSSPGPARIVAWGMVLRRRTRWADVHPDARGQGLGAALIAWSVRRAQAVAADRIGQTVEDCRADAIELFERSGAVAVRTAWILHRDLGPAAAPLNEPPRPAGIVLRAATPDDEIAALGMMELAFSQWPDRPPSEVSTWQAMVTGRAGFRFDQLQLAVTAQGHIVGAAFLLDDPTELWIDKLATHPEHQGRGIGSALLWHAFAIAQARGRPRVRLSTDSHTGALPFYERAGMRVARSFTHWAIPLADGSGPR